MTYRRENTLLLSSEEQLCHLLHLRKLFKERSQIQSDNEKLWLNPMTYLNYFCSVHSQNLCSILHVFNAVFHFIHFSPAALSHIVYYSFEALNVNMSILNCMLILTIIIFCSIVSYLLSLFKQHFFTCVIEFDYQLSQALFQRWHVKESWENTQYVGLNLDDIQLFEKEYVLYFLELSGQFLKRRVRLI